TKKIGTKEIETELIKADINVSASSINDVKQLLYKQEGIMHRQEGQKKIIYYHSTKENNNQELKKALPQKIKYMA
ncbi:MAG: hypothetical protein GWN62_08595, partial [Aliifodinibius sp.]|nr:hypothetical protein [Fodinibius sp.]